MVWMVGGELDDEVFILDFMHSLIEPNEESMCHFIINYY